MRIGGLQLFARLYGLDLDQLYGVELAKLGIKLVQAMGRLGVSAAHRAEVVGRGLWATMHFCLVS